MKDTEDPVQKEGLIKGDLLKELQSIIENIAKKEGYITFEIFTTNVNSGGANYLGELFEVDIKGKTKDGEKETNLFVKKAVSEGSLGDLIGVSDVYVTENYVYQVLAKRFQELQIEANVPEEERHKMVNCFETSDSSTIVLENMAKKAFRIPHRMNVVSLKYAELCMEQLAKFHALSFALKIKDPDYFENKVRPYKYPIKDDEATRISWDNLAKNTIKNLDSDYKRKAEKAVEAYHKRVNTFFDPEYSSITCLCHGDFRGSNILMREDEGEVAEVIPVDYQVIYVGCPVNDLLFFLAFGTDRKFRHQHLERLKNLYYDTLTNFLKYFDLNSSDVFPRKELEHLFQERMDYVAMIAVLVFPFIFAPENALDINELLMKGNLDLDERYKERLIEILEDFPVQCNERTN